MDPINELKRNQLPDAQKFKLWNYTREQYKASGLNNTEFAKKATADLGFRVTDGNIYGALTALEIVNNFPRGEKQEAEHTALLRSIDGKLDQLIDLMTRPTKTPGG